MSLLLDSTRSFRLTQIRLKTDGCCFVTNLKPIELNYLDDITRITSHAIGLVEGGEVGSLLGFTKTFIAFS